MAEADLSRLNPISFERLVRALAFAQFGPSGTVFSAGPDGGRDFIFEGVIPGYEARGWNGYLVLQAKFRDKLEDNAHDLDWLVTQIKAEFAKYVKRNRALRPPEYYIIATNIGLTGADTVDGKGGLKLGTHSKITEALTAVGQTVGLRDFHVWSADHIIDRLASYPAIRQTYAAWVTPGDVLEAALSQLQAKRPDFSIIIKRALKRRVAADQFVPLNEVGSADPKKVQTSQVFIDLPVRLPDNDTRMYDDQNRGCVAEISNIARSRLDPESSRESETQGRASALKSRLVLLGGPGQGKSTTGLFVAQLYRALILREDARFKDDPTICEVVPSIIARAEDQGLRTRLPLRFPLHTLLPVYADVISRAREQKVDPPSLLNHIASDIGRAGDGSVDRDDLRSWLKSYPWVIVLDGLDEVPPSGERPAVISAISGLVSEIAEAQADVLLIVTTRPQGYNKDLDERYWSHWHLVDLPPEKALKYGAALSLALHPYDEDRRSKIETGLGRAMRQPATARLMVSPLQVTIMHLIVDGGGSAPVGRWPLFNEYFQILKKRERAKGGDTFEVLERNWDHLDPVHYRAGLVLQAQSETAGKAGAHFDRPRLRCLIEGYLASCGYRLEQREALSDELAQLALHRLVLLSTRQQGQTEDEGQISFDVRSLQEFMAAAQLTTGTDLEASSRPRIEERLTHIAGMAHWRHVFLIAASRCFTDTALTHLRSVVVAIPRSLDVVDSDRIAGSGARLALDMLADGIGVTHPISRFKLLEHALELLDLGPDAFDDRLVEICSSEQSSIIEDRLRACLSQGTTREALSGWRLLCRLCKADSGRFQTIANEYWPADADAARAVAAAAQFVLPSENIECRAAAALISETPLQIFGEGYLLSRPLLDELKNEHKSQAYCEIV